MRMGIGKSPDTKCGCMAPKVSGKDILDNFTQTG